MSRIFYYSLFIYQGTYIVALLGRRNWWKLTPGIRSTKQNLPYNLVFRQTINTHVFIAPKCTQSSQKALVTKEGSLNLAFWPILETRQMELYMNLLHLEVTTKSKYKCLPIFKWFWNLFHGLFMSANISSPKEYSLQTR